MLSPEPALHIFWASLIASFVIGALAVLLSPKAHTPAEACFFPSLLPMIPGMYAYKAFGGLAACVLNDDPDKFGYYFYQFASNGFVCLAVLAAMVVGATLPLFMFKKSHIRPPVNTDYLLLLFLTVLYLKTNDGTSSDQIFRETRRMPQFFRGVAIAMHHSEHTLPADKTA